MRSGIDAASDGFDEQPVFVTVTRTVGLDHGHTDVSLWFLVTGHRGQPLTLDRGEFRDARWWSPAEIGAAEPARFDPHFVGFVAKINATR
jgi:8-oxo-dGTP diphosphatase